MKKILAVFLACILVLPMTACSYIFELSDAMEGGLDEDSYKVPVILIHGRDSNTSVFYGVHTGINKNTNSCYLTKDDDKTLYTKPVNHKIKTVDEGKLGKYLIDELGYETNVNLFAFNYPNEDMVARNANLLEQYINNLVAAGQIFEDGRRLFASEEDREDGRVKFILIGHSMGGLISRYYIENIDNQYVEKLITIDSPHYGSSLAKFADNSGLAFLACDVDLRWDSWLFGGERRKALLDSAAETHGYKNQSSPLKGNQDTNVPYYAIGGYAIDGDQLAGALEKHINDGGAFRVDFDRKTESKEAFQKSINDALNAASMAQFGEPSTLDLSDIDGDNVVDYMSQFAVNFNEEAKVQKLEKTVLILADDKALSMLHTTIAEVTLMHEAVKDFIVE